jgi:hypothetical protein
MVTPFTRTFAGFASDNIQNQTMTDASITAAQKEVCKEHAASFVGSPPDSKLGFARTTKGKVPINGLRHPLGGNTNGWYIWCGEDFSDDSEFFAPVHASHFYEEYPEVARFLGLPPGYRFLFAPNCIDIWFDESLLKV